MEPLTLGLVISNKELWTEAQQGILDLPVRVVLERQEFGEWAEFVDKLDRTRPDALLVDITELGEDLEMIARKLKATAVAPAIIALHTSADPEVILRAMRAGIGEFVYPPLEGMLRGCLDRLSSERSRDTGAEREGGKVIGFLSVKGGCGATTIACHVASYLHGVTDQKVLLADLDMEASLVGFLMKSGSRYSVMDAVSNIHRLDLSFWKALVSNGHPGLEVISAPSQTVAARQATPDELRHVLRFSRNHYSWTLADLGRGLSAHTLTVLEEVDETCLIASPDVPSLHQAKGIIETLLNTGHSPDRIRLIMNRIAKRSEVTVEEMERMLGIPVFAVLPSLYNELYDSYADGRLLPQTTNLGKHFLGLTRKLAGVTERELRRFSLFGR